jgi:hypothetical protein
VVSKFVLRGTQVTKLVIVSIILSLSVSNVIAEDLSALFKQQQLVREEEARIAGLAAAKARAEQAARDAIVLKPYLDNPVSVDQAVFLDHVMRVFNRNNIRKGLPSLKAVASDLEVYEVDTSKLRAESSGISCQKSDIGSLGVRGYIKLEDGIVYKIDLAPQQRIVELQYNPDTNQGMLSPEGYINLVYAESYEHLEDLNLPIAVANHFRNRIYRLYDMLQTKTQVFYDGTRPYKALACVSSYKLSTEP